MSKDRLAEIYTQMTALEDEAAAIQTVFCREFIEKITGMKVPDDVKNIELSYSYTRICEGVELTDAHRRQLDRTRIHLLFDDDAVYTNHGAPSNSKYPELTKKLKELLEDPIAFAGYLEEYSRSMPTRKARKSDASWMMFR